MHDIFPRRFHLCYQFKHGLSCEEGTLLHHLYAPGKHLTTVLTMEEEGGASQSVEDTVQLSAYCPCCVTSLCLCLFRNPISTSFILASFLRLPSIPIFTDFLRWESKRHSYKTIPEVVLKYY